MSRGTQKRCSLRCCSRIWFVDFQQRFDAIDLGVRSKNRPISLPFCTRRHPETALSVCSASAANQNAKVWVLVVGREWLREWIHMIVSTYLGKHAVRVLTKVWAKHALVNWVQILLHDASSVWLLITGWVQDFDWLRRILGNPLDLLEMVATLLLACFKVALCLNYFSLFIWASPILTIKFMFTQGNYKLYYYINRIKEKIT